MMHGTLKAVPRPTAEILLRPLLFSLALFSITAMQAKADIDVMNPPGELVDIGGYRLHIDCRGEGSPTVVMEAGLGGVSLEWLPVQRFLSHYGRVCSYDRAGNGWSDIGPEPRTSSVIVNELYTLLKNAAVPGPYILVGHSFGGYTAQLFAERYPYLTAGLVLVDSSHPDQVARFEAPPLNMVTAPGRESTGVMLMSGPPVIPAHMPEEIQQTAMMLMALRKTRMTVAQEYLYFRDSGEQILRTGKMPSVPLVVITRGVSERDPSDDQTLLIEDLWMTLQDELAATSGHSAHLVANRSGHHIHLDQPHLVADAVTMVLDFARARSGLTQQPQTSASTWLAFADATWRADRLHQATESYTLLDEHEQIAAVLPVQAGHLAWTPEPSVQRVTYLQHAAYSQ